MRTVFRLVLTSLLASAAVLAQTTAGMGGLSGVVRDASGASIPNAAVVVANESNGIRRNLNTNEAGVFSAPALVPAAGYSVKVTAQGFAPYEARDILIEVGQQVNLPIVLGIAAATTQVEVTGVAALVEDTKTDVSQVVNTQQIQELPINGRRVDSFVLLTPAVTADGTFGLLSFRGTVGGNTFLTDGNDSTQQFYNENAGRTRISSQISQDAVQEFQVLSAGYTAEYGRAIGGVVNTVTRSGTNSLRGTAYWFFRNQDFNARDRYAATNPPESRHQAGASLGGPLVKDKLFYFGNFELTRRDFPLSASLSRPNVIENGVWVGCGAPATAAQCAAINALLKPFFGEIPRTVEQNLGFVKIDYRPTERHSFSVSANYLGWFSPNGIQTAAALNTGSQITSNGLSTVRHRLGRAVWTSVVSTSAVNEARFGWFKDRQADQLSPELSPPYQVSVTVASQAIGIPNYLPRVSPSENRYQFADNFTWTRGRHTMKFGFDFSNTEDYQDYLSNRFGSYTYGNVSNFAADYSGNTTGAKRYQTYSQTLGNPRLNFTIRDYAFFAQDQFRAGRKLTLNLGVRYDYEVLPQPPLQNPDYPQTGRIVSDRTNFAPRVGLAYSLDEKTVLRAGYGLFYGRVSGGLLSTLFTANAVYTKSITISNPVAGDPTSPVFPARLDSSNLPGGTVSISFAAPNLRTPYTQHGDFAIERQFGRSTSLTASYIFSRGVQLFVNRDLNLGVPTASYTYIIRDASGNNVGVYTTPVWLSSGRVDRRYNSIMQVENSGRSYYDGLAVQLRKRMSKGFQGSLAYTWSHAIDTGLGNGGDSAAIFYSGAPTTYNGNYRDDKGSGSNDQRHRLVGTFVAQPRFTTRTDAFSRYVINNWQLSTLVTIASAYPSRATITVSSAVRPNNTTLAWTGTLNGYGGSTRVPFWQVNPLRIDQIWRADARLSKMLPFGERRKLYLNFEGFNITNSQYNTSVNQTAYTANNGILTPNSLLGVGIASGGFPDGTNARRLQLSGRFVF